MQKNLLILFPLLPSIPHAVIPVINAIITATKSNLSHHLLQFLF